MCVCVLLHIRCYRLHKDMAWFLCDIQLFLIQIPAERQDNCILRAVSLIIIISGACHITYFATLELD